MAGNYKELQQAAGRLNAAEHTFCMQRAKVGYFKQVDRNSSFFHALVKRNNRRNEVTAVEKNDGNLTESFEEVVHVFTEHFQKQLGTTADRSYFPHSCINFGRHISTEQHSQLVRQPTVEEIKAALFDIGDQRAPGSDGYSSKFFKHAWDYSNT